jgi:hypothetical protein
LRAAALFTHSAAVLLSRLLTLRCAWAIRLTPRQCLSLGLIPGEWLQGSSTCTSVRVEPAACLLSWSGKGVRANCHRVGEAACLLCMLGAVFLYSVDFMACIEHSMLLPVAGSNCS